MIIYLYSKYIDDLSLCGFKVREEHGEFIAFFLFLQRTYSFSTEELTVSQIASVSNYTLRSLASGIFYLPLIFLIPGRVPRT